MTALLEKAIQRASKLSDQEQEAIGALILEEISAESRWDVQFAESQDKLARLADEALTEFNGAHAEAEGMKLVTRDSDRIKTYFPAVKLIVPKI